MIFLFAVSIIPSFFVLFFSLLVKCVVSEYLCCEKNSCRLVHYRNMTVLEYLVKIPQIKVYENCVKC